MRSRVAIVGCTLVVACASASGCVDILGLQPPGEGGTAGSSAGAAGTVSGTAGVAGTSPTGPGGSSTGATGGSDTGGMSGSSTGATGGTSTGATGGTSTGGTGGSATGATGGSVTTSSGGTGGTNTGGSGGSGPVGGALIDVLLVTGNGAHDLRGVTVGPGGEMYVTGTYSKDGNVGTCPLPAIQLDKASGAFVAKITPDLKCQWIATLVTDEAETTLSDLALDGNDLWVIGNAKGSLSLVTPGMSAQHIWVTMDALVMRLQSGTGMLSQLFHIGGSEDDRGRALAANNGVIYALVRGGSGSVDDSNGVPVTYMTSDDADAVLVYIQSNKAGTIRTFGSSNTDDPRALAAGGDKVFVGGNVSAKTVVDGCQIDPNGSKHAYLIDFDISFKWGQDFCDEWGGMGFSVTSSIYASADGRLAVAGQNADIGTANCTTMGGNMMEDNAWLWVSDGASCDFSKIFGGMLLKHSRGKSVKLDGSNVLFGGDFAGTLDGPASAGQDVFVHSYDGKLQTLQWFSDFGAPGDDALSALAVGPDFVAVAGQCSGGEFAGSGKLCGVTPSGFLAKLTK